MVAKKAKGSLLELVKSIPPAKNLNFVDRLSPEIRAELIEIRQQYRDGKLLAHIRAADVYRAIAPALGLRVTLCTFRRWFNEGSNHVHENEVSVGTGASGRGSELARIACPPKPRTASQAVSGSGRRKG
jgi:hypothetical protein